MRDHRKGWKITSSPLCIKNAFVGIWTQSNRWTKGHDAQALTIMGSNFWQLWPQGGQPKVAGNVFQQLGDKSEDCYHEECYSRCDGGSQYRYQTRRDESRDQSHRDPDRHHYEEREYDTYSRDTNNRGGSCLTTSRSEEHSATQATFDYCNVRIKDQQAVRSDYSDLLGHSSGNGYASRNTGHRYGTKSASKVQVFNSTTPNQNPPPGTCKDRTSGSAAWLFQASVTSAGDIRLVQSRDSGYERTSGHDRF